MKTWKKFLPDYEIVVLDFINLQEWLDKSDYDSMMKHKHYYTLPQIADMIRCMLLRKYGGIWFDTDTIITGNFDKIQEIKKERELLTVKNHIGFMFASKDSKIINEWYERNIKKFDYEAYNKQQSKWYKYRALNRKFHIFLYLILGKRKKVEKYRNRSAVDIGWDYLGNSTFNPSCKKYKNTRIDLTARIEYSKFLPEYGVVKSGDGREKFTRFYLESNIGPDEADKIIANGSGMFLLHNSWVEQKYKEMSEKEFLDQHITLSDILKRALGLRTG